MHLWNKAIVKCYLGLIFKVCKVRLVNKIVLYLKTITQCCKNFLRLNLLVGRLYTEQFYVVLSFHWAKFCIFFVNNALLSKTQELYTFVS